MALNLSTIENLNTLLGAQETAGIVRLAKAQQTLETKWARKFRSYIDEVTKEIISNTGRMMRLDLSGVDFLPLVMEHSLAAMREGLQSTTVPDSVPKSATVRMSAPPPAAVPRSLKNLRKWWDHYRKAGKIPARQRAIASRIQSAYIKKIETVWKQNADAFLAGDTTSKTEAIRAIQEGAEVSYGRAKMIVETETTYYYNKARRQVYDQSQDVTHYLFVAVRDHATTKWCSTRQGLVYAKTDPLCDDETPPIHWNCRSEMVPLTPANPRHLALIQDASRQRRKVSPAPLPKEWKRRA